LLEKTLKMVGSAHCEASLDGREGNLSVTRSEKKAAPTERWRICSRIAGVTSLGTATSRGYLSSMALLEYAVTSIELGIEDYNSQDPRRVLSATRNLFAGVLLLFKHKLALLSPLGSDEVLLKQKALPYPSGANIEWRGKGSKAVDVQQITERFESLQITVDWKRVERINKYRNNIEHYHDNRKPTDVRQLIAACFLVIRDFVRDHLGEDPVDLFNEVTWRTLTGVAEVFQKEKAACAAQLTKLTWKHCELKD